MKRFTNILVALGVTLFLLTVGMNSEAEAGLCDLGGAEVKDTVSVDGCDYEIRLCIYCKPNYPGEVKIHSYRLLYGCYTTLTDQEIYDSIIAQITTSAYIILHCEKEIPPCNGTERLNVIFEYPICWKIVLYSINQNPDLNIYYYLPCDDDSYCEVTYSYCIDALGLHTSASNGTLIGTPNCTLESWEITKPTSYVGEESDCYIIHTPCNK